MTTKQSTSPGVSPDGGAVQVTIAPAFDPADCRIRFAVPHGATIADILAVGLAVMPPVERVRVDLVTRDGFWMVDRRFWRIVRPNCGVHVVVRIVPGGQAMRSVLSLLVSVVATALTGPVAGLLGVTSAFGKTVITAGLVMAGGLLLNALFPQKSEKKEKPNYVISGWQNEFAPDAPVPLVLGKIRYAPRFGARTYTEVVGDRLVIRTTLLEGYAPLVRSKPRIGRTDLDKFDEVETEFCDGVPADEPFTLYPAQVLEESQGAELVRERERDDYGEFFGSYIDKPVNRFSARDATAASIIFFFEGGLAGWDDGGFFSGPEAKPLSVSFKIEHRLVGVPEYTLVETITFSENKPTPFFRTHTWAFPVRGQYEIQVTRTTNNSTNANVRDKAVWFALQSYRPEYPINFPRPLCLQALRVRATNQLNGTLDTFNEILSSPARRWNGSSWGVGETQNPVALAIHILSGDWNPHPATDGEVDWPAFEDWYEECADKDLAFNRVIDFEADVDELLAMVGAAGRGAVWFDGEKWTVTIDRPRSIVVDHISTRNASNFRWSTTYFEPPDGHRVTFIDETNDYEEGERVVPWPADHRYALKSSMLADLSPRANRRAEVYADPVEANNGYFTKVGASGTGSWAAAPLNLIEALDLPGITNPDQIWMEARRLQYERIYRNTIYTATQAGSVRRAGPGDLVMLARDVLVRAMHAGAVVAVVGRRVEVDAVFAMEEGTNYALRWRRYTNDNDSVGESILRQIKTEPGEHKAVTFLGSGEVPRYGDIVHFGPLATDSIPVIVAGIERGEDNASIISMLPAADEMHERLATEVPPAWNGRVGTDLGTTSTPPAMPKVIEVRNGRSGTGDPNGLEISMRPGAGPIPTGSFQIQHRLLGATLWSGPISVSAGSGAIAIPGYVSGDTVQWQPRAVSIYGVPSAWGSSRSTVIGILDPSVPAALDNALITVTGGMGKADVAFALGASVNPASITHVQIYRNTSGVFNTADAVLAPIPVTPGSTYSRVLGDGTRKTVVQGGDFNTSPGAWIFTAPVTISGGTANKASGAAPAELVQNVPSIPAGSTVRGWFDITSVGAGLVRARTRVGSGGAVQDSADKGTVGTHLFSIGPLANTIDRVGLIFDVPSVMSVGTFELFVSTAQSLPQGTNYIWLQPINAGVPGPLSGPFAVTVI